MKIDFQYFISSTRSSTRNKKKRSFLVLFYQNFLIKTQKFQNKNIFKVLRKQMFIKIKKFDKNSKFLNFISKNEEAKYNCLLFLIMYFFVFVIDI